MKGLKIFFITIIAIILLTILGVFIFVKVFDINKYLPQINRQIGQTIGRKVNIEQVNLDFNLMKGISLDLKSLTTSDDALFSNKNFLEIDKIHVGLDVWTLISKREIHATNITIVSPKIFLIRSAQGQINAQTLAPTASNGSLATGSTTGPKTNATIPAAALPVLLVKSISIEHAQVSFEDQNPPIPLHILIPNIEAKIDDFSLTEPFSFTIGINAWSKGLKNVNIGGYCRLNLSNTRAQITDLELTSDLSQWDWNKVKAITPTLKNIPVWPQETRGNVLVKVPTLNVSAKGIGQVSANLVLSGGYIKLKEILSPIDNISVQIESDLNNLSMKQLQAHIGSGEIEGKSDIKNLLTSAEYSFQLQSKGVKIEELLDEKAWATNIKGAITGQFTGSGQGFKPEEMLNNIKGQGEFNLSDAKIEKLNILKTILDKLNFIPGLGIYLEGSLPSNVKDKLDTDTTILDKAQTKIKVENKIISVDGGQVESKIFSIAAQGSINFDLATNINVKTYLASDLSAALVKSAKPLQGLLDEQNRLYIPGEVVGKYPSIMYRPQVDYITKKVVTSEGTQQIGQQLQKVLDKNPQVQNILNAVLGGGQNQEGASDNSSNSPVDQPANTDGQAQPQEKPSKKLINNLLKSILR